LRKGFALVIAVSMGMLLTGLAVMLFQSANLDMMIAGNKRRHFQASMAAQSGMNHFAALQYDYDQLKNLAGDNLHLDLILEERMSDKHSYKVIIKFCCGEFGEVLGPGEFYVQSTGWYKRNTKHESIATYQSFYSLDNNDF
jgi:hypothetical protein